MALPLVSMNSSYHSIRHEAGLDYLKACVAHCMEEEEGLLADPSTVMVEDSKTPTSFLFAERLS